MAVTIKDIARELSLSVTTVSRALGDHDDVSSATKERVRAVASRLDYHPNLAARSLQNSRANALGLVIPLSLHRTYDAFWLEFIGGMAAACAYRGFDLSISAASASAEVVDTFRRWVRGRRVDGLVLCDVRRDDPRFPYLKSHRIPFVAFGRSEGAADYPYIDVDGVAGGLHGVQHLTALGHTRIAYLGVDPAFGFSHFRLEGYREALTRARLPYDSRLVFEGVTESTALAVASELFSLDDRPTAVFAAADFLALTTLRAARSAGLNVPHDVSVVVFDDNLPVQHAEPPITAVSQPNRRLGEEAATLLLDRVANPSGPLAQRLVVPSLVVRSSTAAPGRAVRPGAVERALELSHIPVLGPVPEYRRPVTESTRTGE